MIKVEIQYIILFVLSLSSLSSLSTKYPILYGPLCTPGGSTVRSHDLFRYMALVLVIGQFLIFLFIYLFIFNF